MKLNFRRRILFWIFVIASVTLAGVLYLAARTRVVPQISVLTIPPSLFVPQNAVSSSAVTVVPGITNHEGWKNIDEGILPIRIAGPDGWQTDATGTDIEIFREREPETQTSAVSIYQNTAAGDHNVDDLLRSTDLVQVTRTTVDGLPAIQGYSYYPYGHPNYSDKDFELFSPGGLHYLISYHCPVDRTICEEIVSRVHFK